MLVQPYISNTLPDAVLTAVNAIFNSCPTVIKNDLLNYITIKYIDKGQVFIKEGEKCAGIYVIADGDTKLYVKKDKKVQIVSFKTVNDIIGMQAAITGENYHYSAVALEDLILAFIPTEQIEKVLATYPNVFFSLIKKVNEHAVAIESRSSLMMSDSAEKVVLKTMEDLKTRFGMDRDGFINLQIPVKDLANYICMSKTNLYRVLNTLKEKALLSHQLDKYRLMY